MRHIKVSSDKIAWLNTYNKINENLATGYFITGKSGYSPDLIDVSTFNTRKNSFCYKNYQRRSVCDTST
ncbi:MAG: hypothetical protein IJ180_09435 [Bacteroidales bacterium]|nr:hypothetical protein [Bacteroidales bacterium]